MKFARTIRFDKSDLNIFPVAAEEGQLALVGTFSFSNIQSQDFCHVPPPEAPPSSTTRRDLSEPGRDAPLPPGRVPGTTDS